VLSHRSYPPPHPGPSAPAPAPSRSSEPPASASPATFPSRGGGPPASRYVKLTKDQDAPGEDIRPGELNQPVHVPQGHNAGAGRQASTHGFVNWLGCVLGRRGWMRTTVTRICSEHLKLAVCRVTSDAARQAAS
uniref:Uncharacterized protein n=1 Tax=Aegilops tauschii subsp. strangulata TaxID=200361 RepID=A0A453RQS0_AEGTS